MLDPQFEAWDTRREELPSYVREIIDSVWDTYGRQEAADIEHDSVVTYFLKREPRDEEVKDLPPAMVTMAKAEVLQAAESESAVYWCFIREMRK